MKSYIISYREGMSAGASYSISSRSPKEAARYVARQLNYSAVSVKNMKEVDDFDSSIRLCVAVKDESTGKVRYYGI